MSLYHMLTGMAVENLETFNVRGPMVQFNDGAFCMYLSAQQRLCKRIL